MIVQVVATIIGITTSIIAVVISILSLKQTQKSIEKANRPYVVVYRDYIQVSGNVHEYFIIKNFGKTGAIIEGITIDPEYINPLRKKRVFDNIQNTFIAPGQSISTVTNSNAFESKRTGLTTVIIDYHSGKNHYQEEIILNEELDNDFAFIKTSPSKNKTLEEIITKATEELLRRQL